MYYLYVSTTVLTAVYLCIDIIQNIQERLPIQHLLWSKWRRTAACCASQGRQTWKPQSLWGTTCMYITPLVFVFYVLYVLAVLYQWQINHFCSYGVCHSDSLTVDPFTMATRWDVIGMRNVWLSDVGCGLRYVPLLWSHFRLPVLCLSVTFWCT